MNHTALIEQASNNKVHNASITSGDSTSGTLYGEIFSI